MPLTIKGTHYIAQFGKNTNMALSMLSPAILMRGSPS
jgi:hypothetical protein